MATDANKHYNKPGKTFVEQVRLLRERGMHIEDHHLAKRDLSRIGYYRLSGYWKHLRVVVDGQKQERFVPGASWDQVMSIYDFDNRLKTLLFEAIGAIEIAVRTQLTYHLYIKGGLIPIWINRFSAPAEKPWRKSCANAANNCATHAPRKSSSDI